MNRKPYSFVMQKSIIRSQSPQTALWILHNSPSPTVLRKWWLNIENLIGRWTWLPALSCNCLVWFFSWTMYHWNFWLWWSAPPTPTESSALKARTPTPWESSDGGLHPSPLHLSFSLPLSSPRVLCGTYKPSPSLSPSTRLPLAC